MDQAAIRILIRAKIQDGHLPRDGAPQPVGRPGNGQNCVACDDSFTAARLMMEITENAEVFFLHGDCYLLLMDEHTPKS